MKVRAWRLAPQRRARALGVFVFVFWGIGSGDCGANHRNGPVPRCGSCDRSADCHSGLSCVNGVCETVPLTCHVEFGI
jgi:hypothetical protein